MRRSALMAAIGGVLALSSLSQAAFTITFAPSAQPATQAGRFAFDFFAQNDANTADGVNLQAAKPTFTGINGTKVFFEAFEEAPGVFATDQYNFGTGTSGTNVTNPNASNLRIGNRTAGQHAYTNYPGDADSPLNADQATNGLSSFTADYAVLSALNSVPAAVPPGARFARLVFNTQTPAGTLSGDFAGETGPTSSASVILPGVVGPTNTPPVVPAVTPGTVTFGQIVDQGAAFSVQIPASDLNATDVLTLTVGVLPAGVSNVTVSPSAGGTQPQIFTVNGTVSFRPNGSTVSIPFSVSDGTASTPGQIVLTIVPEPTSMLALAGAAGLGLIRRRK